MTAAREGLSVGDIVAQRSYHLTRDTLVRYAGASGDFNRSITATMSPPRSGSMVFSLTGC